MQRHLGAEAGAVPCAHIAGAVPAAFQVVMATAWGQGGGYRIRVRADQIKTGGGGGLGLGIR